MGKCFTLLYKMLENKVVCNNVISNFWKFKWYENIGDDAFKRYVRFMHFLSQILAERCAFLHIAPRKDAIHMRMTHLKTCSLFTIKRRPFYNILTNLMIWILLPKLLNNLESLTQIVVPTKVVMQMSY